MGHEKEYTVTLDERAALDAANSPTASNPVATMADVGGAATNLLLSETATWKIKAVTPAAGGHAAGFQFNPSSFCYLTADSENPVSTDVTSVATDVIFNTSAVPPSGNELWVKKSTGNLWHAYPYAPFTIYIGSAFGRLVPVQYDAAATEGATYTRLYSNAGAYEAVCGTDKTFTSSTTYAAGVKTA